MSNSELSTSFFLQMAAIIATCRIVGWAVRRWLGQPQVVGEMIAGVVLGPSLLGALMPSVETLLFPAESQKLLYVGAQLGVGLYMFLVGLTFNRAEFSASARGAALISLGGMAAPFVAAAVLVPWLMGRPGLFGANVDQTQAALFLGAAIAITAFPMLARIIHERGLTGSRLGTLSLSAGAIGDAGAWVVMALVLASLGKDDTVAIKAGVGGLAFAAAMITIAPRLLRPLALLAERRGVDETLMATALTLFLLAACAMDAAGMHAVFGGFLLGTAMPRGRFSRELHRRLEPFTTCFLLPMFFTYSGLNTDMRVLGHVGLIGVTLTILATAIITKGGACYLAARASGESQSDAMGLGALMNARGMMELIIINIGLAHGIIGPALFAMLVLMAIVTTLMASPLFTLFCRRPAPSKAQNRTLPAHP